MRNIRSMVRAGARAGKVPRGEVDLLVGCGELLLVRDSGVPFLGPSESPILVDLLVAQEAAFMEYAAPAGLCEKDFVQLNRRELARRNQKVLAVLENLRQGGSALASALPSLSERVFRLLACLTAQSVFQGGGCSYDEVRHALTLRGSRAPSLLQEALGEIHRHCQGPRALFRWRWRGGSLLMGAVLHLGPGALQSLQPIAILGAPVAEQQEEDPMPHPVEAPGAVRRILHIETSGLPRLEDAILPAEPAREVAYLAALLKVDRRASPVALFHGPPGTGKTHAARALAGETERALGLAELPSLLGKYVGETEKALDRAFEEAARAEAILLLDEADSLLFDRSRAKHPWEILVVDCLLKLLETRRTPVVLCTNLLDLIDPAVLRRLDVFVAFPVPGKEERRRIWALETSRAGLQADVDLQALSTLQLTGGLIRNAVLRSVREGLVAGTAVTAELLLRCARAEEAKMGRSGPRRPMGFGAALGFEEGTKGGAP